MSHSILNFITLRCHKSLNDVIISPVNLIEDMNLSQQTLLGTHYLEKVIANLLFHKLLFSDEIYSVTVSFTLDLSK